MVQIAFCTKLSILSFGLIIRLKRNCACAICLLVKQKFYKGSYC